MWEIATQERALEADDDARAAMTLHADTGESMSLYRLMEVGTLFQDYARKVFAEAAQVARSDTNLKLTEKERGNLEQYPHFLQVFVTLQQYLRHPVRYGNDTLKMWLNLYKGMQYSLGNDSTCEQKRLLTVVGWSPFNSGALPFTTVEGRGSVAAGTPVGASLGGSGGLTSSTVKREKGARVKPAAVKEPGAYLPESVFTLGPLGHLVEGPCATCGGLTHFQMECPIRFEQVFKQPMPGFHPSAGGTCAESLRRSDYYAPGGGVAEYVLKAWARHEWAPMDKTFEEQLKDQRPRAHFWAGWRAVFDSL